MSKIIEAPLHRLPAKKIGLRTGIPLYGIMHATRGAANGNQFLGTINWFTSNNNGGEGWGPSADMVIGGVGQHDGEVALFTDLGRGQYGEHPRWSAGRGAAGTFPADEHGFSVEVAQSEALEDYTDAQVARVAEVMAECNRRWGIPLRRIPFLDQVPGKAIPRGWVGHEDTANGRFTGKSDPGSKFPWARCFAAAEALLVPVALTPAQVELLAYLESPAGKALPTGTRTHLLERAGLDKHGRPLGSPTPTPTPPATPATYTVRAGDVLSAIAGRYALATADLAVWNGISDPNRIEVGQVLALSAPPATPAPPQPDALAIEAARDEGYRDGYREAAGHYAGRIGSIELQARALKEDAQARAANPPARK